MCNLKISRPLRQLRRTNCSLADLWLFLRIFVFAALVPLLMRIKLPQLERYLHPAAFPSHPNGAQVEKIIRYTDKALRLGKPLLQVKCLTRGLTLYYFLRRAGVEVSLCFGAETFDERFAAHCWLIKDGEPFSEPQDPRRLYTPVYTLPRTQRSSRLADRE